MATDEEMRNMKLSELLNFVDRSNPEVRELARRIEYINDNSKRVYSIAQELLDLTADSQQ